MNTKQQAEKVDAHTMQREKEREKRRLRDRIRRQNMSKEQREKHLARRRRNYQLRRLRAAQTSNQQTKTPIICTNIINSIELEIQDEETQQMRKYPRRLRVSDIKHLARRLNCDEKMRNGGVLTSCVATKRLRLTHVKRLARAVNLTVE